MANSHVPTPAPNAPTVHHAATVARPLKVLIPLIQCEITLGHAAGLEHYRQAGELLLEAREQVAAFRWGKWLKDNFVLSRSTAYEYMTLAERIRDNPDLVRTSGQTLLGIVYPEKQRKRATQRAAFKIPAWVNRITEESQQRQRDLKLLRDLALRVVDSGYKLHAEKLHPDKGGSTDAMARLNHVRAILRGVIGRQTW